MYSRILVTVDGSGASEAILPQVEGFADASMSITLFTAVDVPAALANPVRPLVVAGAAAPGGVVRVPGAKMAETRSQAIERLRDEQEQYLGQLAKPLRKLGLNVQTRVAFGPDAGEEILNAAKDLKVDAIFMATHGHTALGQIVFGSVAEKVVQAGQCPVLLIRPKELG
jgi:nucleotide-binding universal stress UspA family protein